MRFTTFCQLLVLAPFVQAFVIPKGTEDGAYVVYTNDQGHEIHERLAPALASHAPSIPEETFKVSPNPQLMPRQFGAIEYFCGCGNQMNHDNCDSAVAALTADMYSHNGIVPARSNFYSIQGSVVAFFCNRGETVGEAPANMKAYFAEITNRCGWYTAGTYSALSSGRSLHFLIGYMNYYHGLDYCAHADGTSQHSC